MHTRSRPTMTHLRRHSPVRRGLLAAVVSCAALTLVTGSSPGLAGALAAQDEQPPRFKAGVARVTVGVTVRDGQGRLVTDLGADDFTVLDSGVAKPLTDFQVGARGISIAAVIDGSGSMSLAGRIQLARQALGGLFAALGEEDEAALFTFDSVLREVQPFTRDSAELQSRLERIRPFGSTAIHDAIAQAARAVTTRTHTRRAVLLVTDGFDTSSELSASDASAIASSVDVPIYILGVEPSKRRTTRVERCAGPGGGKSADLACLALWTGGAFSVARNPEEAGTAVEQVVSELRHQYLLAFEPGTEPGWHSIEVRARGGRLSTRTRTWYWVSTARS